MEQGRGIEPLALAWKAKVLPLYEPCGVNDDWCSQQESNWCLGFTKAVYCHYTMGAVSASTVLMVNPRRSRTAI